jgi:hypothetical protein
LFTQKEMLCAPHPKDQQQSRAAQRQAGRQALGGSFISYVRQLDYFLCTNLFQSLIVNMFFTAVCAKGVRHQAFGALAKTAAEVRGCVEVWERCSQEGVHNP